MRPVARIAQSVEQGIENPRVRGSIPRPGTTIQKTQPYGWVFCAGRIAHPAAAETFKVGKSARHRLAVQRLRSIFRLTPQRIFQAGEFQFITTRLDRCNSRLRNPHLFSQLYL